ncbi:MAG: BTAD domain-containing putative transcriptional regulator, partial [Alphaproteobacteria bacterium]
GASVLALDPLDEATLRQLMELQAGSGRRNAALQQYRHFADLLRHELDTAPEAETRALHQRLLRDPPRSATPPEPLRLARAPVRPPEVVVARFGADAGDAAARAVADELRDDLLTALTRRRGLRVLTEAGDGLVADPRAQDRRYLVEAGVRIRAAEVVVTARLMDAGDRSCLWSERCAGPPDRLLGPEVPLAQRLAVSFVREIEVAEARKAAGTEPDALDAWSHYHLALHHLYRFSLPGLNAAHAHLQRAVALDPGLAVAHARLAYAHLQMYWYGPPEARDESLDRSQLAALQAVGLDAKDARGHFALGRLFAIRREFDMAIPEFETAIGLDPSFAQASFGLGQALAAAAQPASSVPFLDRAIDLDPHDPHLWTFYHDRAEARFALGDLAEAAKNSKVAVRLPNASHFAWATLASVLGVAGDQENAGRALARLRLFRPGYSLDHAVAELAHHANRLFVGDYLAGLELAGLGHEQPGTADEDGRQADQGPLLTGQGPLF